MVATSSEVESARDLLTILRRGQPRTKPELAAMTGQARSTVSARLDTLIDHNLVTTLGHASSTGGRPSVLYAFRSDAGVALAAELGARHTLLAVTDLSGAILADEQADVDIVDGPESVLKHVTTGWQSLLDKIGASRTPIIGAGIGLPGPVEHSTGRPVSPPIMPGWDGFDVAGTIRSDFDVPVFVDNDANLLALGEWSSHCPDETDMIVVKVATGIGAGIVSGGTLIRGSQGVAGDIGHIAVRDGGDRLCRCGQLGCLEAVASGRGIAETLRMEGIDAHTSSDVVALVRAGNARATRATRDAGRVLGEILSACVALLNPNQILIGGTMADAGETLLAGVRETVYRRTQPLSTRKLTISTSRSDDFAGTIGAARMALDAALG